MNLAGSKSAAVLLIVAIVPLAAHAGSPEKKFPSTLEKRASSLAFSPDGKTLACDLVLYDLATGKVVAKGEPGEDCPPCFRVAFSPDGNRLASAHDTGLLQARHGVSLWDVSRRGEMRKTSTLFLRDSHYPAYGASLYYLAFSPDGRMLVTRTLDDGAVVWETASGKERRTLDVRGLAVAFGADGRTLTSVTRDGLVRHWNLVTGKCADPADDTGRDGFLFVVEAVASADGRTIALTDGYSVWLKSADTGKTLRRFNDLNGVSCLALSPDGKLLAVANRTGIAVFNGDTGKPCRRLNEADAASLAFSADGKLFASALEKAVLVRELAPAPVGREVRNGRTGRAAPLEGTVTSRKATYALDLGGKSVEELARSIRAGTLPPSPTVDLVVAFRNTGDNKVTLYLDGDFDAYLVGDGAINHPELPVQTAIGPGPFLERKKVVLAPGESHSLPLTTLSYEHGRQSYWLSPGEYTLYVSYHAQVDPAPEGWAGYEEGKGGSGFGTMHAAPIRLKVVAEKR